MIAFVKPRPPDSTGRLTATRSPIQPAAELGAIGMVSTCSAAIVRLVGAILLEQNDEWAVQRCRDVTLESVAPLSDDPLVSLPAVAG